MGKLHDYTMQKFHINLIWLQMGKLDDPCQSSADFTQFIPSYALRHGSVSRINILSLVFKLCILHFK